MVHKGLSDPGRSPARVRVTHAHDRARRRHHRVRLLRRAGDGAGDPTPARFALARGRSAGRRRGRPTAPDLPGPAGRRHPAAAPDPPDRARDLRRDRARLLGAELPQRQPDERLPRLHGRHEDRRRLIRRDRSRPERAAADARGRPAGPDQGDRGPRSAAEAGHDQRRGDRPARPAPGRARGVDRVAAVPLQRPQRPGRRFRRAREHAGRNPRRQRARGPGGALRRQRRDLGRPLRGAVEGRARGTGDQRRPGSELRLPDHPGPLEPAVDDRHSGDACKVPPKAARRPACTGRGSSR